MTYRFRILSGSFFGLAVIGATGCAPDELLDDRGRGPVAHDANEAWPNRPADVPVLSAEQIANACAIAGTCAPDVMELELETRAALVDLCVSDVVFSAERAIPMSGFHQSNERPEFWVRCVLDNADQCAAVSQCRTDRVDSIYCEEDGCMSSVDNQVSCDGDIATLKSANGTSTRDCARAFAVCDPKSPTGCSDRQLSSCPEDYSKADRCDGDVRLGCDGKNQVSYRDCTRMGGTCSAGDCVYPADAECPKSAECSGTTLSVCVAGRHLSFETALCAH